jgi:hypothetical protein
MAKKATEVIAIHISPNTEAVKEGGKLLMSILESENDQETKRAALAVVPRLLGPENITIHDCVFNIKGD